MAERMTVSNTRIRRRVDAKHEFPRRMLAVAPADHDLTVIIPAFNEEGRLPATLEQLIAYLDTWGVDYRVLVADDGSSDRTATLTDDRGPRCSTVRLIPQGGKGRAVRTAMLQGTGRVLAFTDADLPFDLTALREGYAAIAAGDCDVVFGARDLETSVSVAQRRLSRHVATLVFRQVVKHLVSHEVTDTQCGLKLFSRRAALDIFSRTTIDGFAFDAEVVMLTHHLDLAFQRVPVKLLNEYSSTLSVWRSALPMLLDVLKLTLRRRFGGGWPAPQFVRAGETVGNAARHLKDAA